MENAGIWLRVSSGGQDEANQEPDILRYCQQHKYNIARRYEVHAKSAFKGHHQRDLDRMIADIHQGHITVLVVWHSDRLERREGKALLDLLAEVSVAGGRVESTKEPQLGQIDMGSQLFTFATGLMNHEKSAHLSEQVGIAHARIDAVGAFRGRIPFGYRTEGPKYSKRLVPTDQGRELVPDIYERVIAGQSLQVIADWLTERTGPGQCATCRGAGKVEGKKCRDCITWWPKVVAELVRRPVYMGHHANSAGVTVHRCDPLLVTADGKPDAATWKRANDNLNARPKRGKVYAENRAMLAGALTCPNCEDSPMVRNTGTNYEVRNGVKTGRISSQHVYYRCQGKGAQRKGCGNMVLVDLVDRAANVIIAATFINHVTVRTLIPGHDHSAELTELAYELQQVGLKGLSWDEEDAERSRLRKEYDRIKELPSVPDRWEEVPNGHSYAGLWADIPIPERGQWLKEHGFTVMATRESVTVAQNSKGISATLPLTELTR